jgi:hypothetical protein
MSSLDELHHIFVAKDIYVINEYRKIHISIILLYIQN